MAWPTVGAVEKGVEVAAVAGIEQLLEARAAHRGVGGHAGGRASSVGALENGKCSRRAPRSDALGLDRVDAGEGRGLVGKRAEERGEIRPLGLEQDAVGVVQHPARELETAREAVDEGPEPHALHEAAHTHTRALHRLRPLERHGAPTSARTR